MSSPDSRPLTPAAILILALLSAVAPLATDMYLPGFPDMAEHLQADAATIQATLTSFLLGLALGQLFIGTLSDRWGRRVPLLAGTALAAAAGLACAFAPDTTSLIVLRALQGLGGGAGVVLARAIIADRSSDATAAARLFQIMMVIGGLAPVLAPIIGTGIVHLAGWRAVFAMIALLSALALVGSALLLKESLPPARRSPGSLSALWCGIGVLVSDRRFLGHALTVGFSFMAMFAYIAASPFVFQEVMGLSPLAYAIAFGTNAIGIALLAGIAARRVGPMMPPARLARLGLCALLAGAALTLLAVLAGAGPLLVLPAVFLAIAPVGVVLGNASALAITRAQSHAGTASALIGAMQFCFGAAASPLVGLAGKDNALPMALVMLAAALAAVACFWLAMRDPALGMPGQADRQPSGPMPS